MSDYLLSFSGSHLDISTSNDLTGALDCMWLATVADGVFSLDAVMYNSAGVPLYRSRSLDQRSSQIIVAYLDGETRGAGLCKQKFFIDS